MQADAAVRHVLRLVQLGSMGLDAALMLADVDPPMDPEARRQALGGLCKGVTEALLPDAQSGDFTRRFFSATDRRRVARLSRQVQAGVLDTLRSTLWLHPRTRREMMGKMAAAKTYAGGLRLPDAYADVVIPRGLSNSTYAEGLVSVGGVNRRRLWAALYHPAAADAWGNPNCVRGTMGQAPALAAAFQCPAGAPYHPPPADRCGVYYGPTMTRRAGAGVPGAKAMTEAPKLTVRQYRELSSAAATTPTRSRAIGLGGRGRRRRCRLVLRLPCKSHPSRALLGMRF